MLKEIPKFTFAAEWLTTIRSIKVESLDIRGCEELSSLRENKWELLTQLMLLGTLSVEKFLQIVSIGSEEREALMQLKIPRTIQHLIIRDCEMLEKLSTALHYVTSPSVLELWSCPKLGENVDNSKAFFLEQLDIYKCPSLVSLSSIGDLTTSLKQLGLSDCAKLESIAQEIQDNCSLEFIEIVNCRNINNLPQGLNKVSHLQGIHIR
ncbi:hypothetical protein DITRI_Ditri09bG0057600 [Diplodiscus trichospermus]